MNKKHWNTGKQHALKPPEERKDTVITLRVKSCEREEWRLQAKELGMSLGQFIRFKCNGGTL